MDLVGYLLGNRYEIIEKVGDGGMATVYKARCRMLNRYVAVKVLKEEYVNDADFTRKFTTEAQAAASLSHPNIVSIYDVGKEGNINYIVMELIEGKTLKELIKVEGKLHWREACKIAYEIAQGLEHAHKNNIIHRDVKPHNIIVTNDMKIKVTDFGIAKAVTSSTITMSGDAIGSVHYFSPEQARGGVTTQRSDIYSLGVVLYEMLTGTLPFNGESPVSVALKHVQEKPKTPSDIEITVPYSVSNIVLKAMQKDENLRYQNISDMALDLNLVMDDPSKEYAKVDNVMECPTQRIKPIKEEIVKTDILNQNEDKNNIKVPNNIEQNSDKNNEEGILGREFQKEKVKPKLSKRKRRMITYIVIAFIGAILFGLCIFGGMYLAGGLNKLNDVEVPDLTNLTIEEAKGKLQPLGLYIEISQEINHNEIEAGRIVNQDISATMRTKKGNTINVTLSKGAMQFKFTDLKGMTLEDAIFELERLKLTYDKIMENSYDYDKNTVIKQEPQADTMITADTKVTIYVSDGVGDGKVKMPTLTEKTLEDAKKIITENNLVLNDNINYKTDTSKPDGVVLSQSIPIGSIIPENTEITLSVNKLKVEKPVEDNPYITISGDEITINLEKISDKSKINVKIINASQKMLIDKDFNRSEKTVTIPVDTDTTRLDVYIENYIKKSFKM